MADPEAPLVALLGKGARYSGDLTFEGRVRVDGHFTGKIFSDDALEVGVAGVVEGDVDVARLIVSGIVRGGVRARERLVIHSGGAVYGQVEAALLECSAGAILDATVRVGE